MDAKSLVESVRNKKAAVENAEALKKQEFMDAIFGELHKFVDGVPEVSFLEALEGGRYVYTCLLLPQQEQKGTRVGKIYMAAVSEAMRAYNEADPVCLLEIETRWDFIRDILAAMITKDLKYNNQNTVIIYIAKKSA